MIRPNPILKAALLAATSVALTSLLCAAPALAQDATWKANPGSGDFYDANNWNPASVPTGTAFFDTSATTALTLGTAGSIGGWTFNSGASAYTFDVNANQTFTGAGIVINGGSATINFNAGTNNIFRNTSTAGSAAITNSGTVQTLETASLGNATITNDAYLYLQDSSSAGGATITNNQTIYFYYGSTAGTATIINNNSLNFSQDSNAGSAHITNAAAAQFDIAHNSTLANATVINSGQMSFWGGAPGYVPTAGNATITNNNGGTLNFRDTSTAGSAAITNNDTVLFTDTSTAGTAAITNNFELYFQNSSSAGGAVIANSGTLNFNDTSTAGNAAITNNSGGTLGFNFASTAGSATITNNNFLGFYGTSTAGSATVVNNTGGNTFFEDSSDGGSARFINNAGSTFDISGLTASGTVAGSIEGAGSHRLGGKTLTVGGNNLSTTVSGVIADGGNSGGTGASLVKSGTGTLTLSGTNSYTGATTIDGGTLAVNSTLTATSGITVNNGGTLGGTGTVGNTTINAGGRLAAGNSIGTLSVSGNLTFNAGSFYTVEVSPTAADRTDVTGIATLTGATVQAIALPGSFRAQTYTILNATGGFGGTQFAGITGSSFAPGARNPHLTYDANNVFLVLDPGTIQLPGGASGNQSNVAGGINRFVEGGGTPPAAFDALLNMSDAQLTTALDQVSGQPAAAGQQTAYNASNQFMTAMFDPFAFGRGLAGSSAPATAPPPKAPLPGRSSLGALSAEKPGYVLADPRWSFWGAVYGGNSSTSGGGGASDTTSRAVGVVAGADLALSRDTTLGFALGGGQSSFGVSGGLGSGDADMVQTGVFAKHEMGAAYVFAGLSYAYQDVTTNRTVTVSGRDELEAKFDSNTVGGRIETGYRYASPLVDIMPYGAVQVMQINLPGYGESAASGSNAFALSYDGNDTTITRTELGARIDRAFKVEDGLLMLRGRLAWAHDEGNDSAVSATFLSLPGSAFTVNGAEPSQNLALVSAGAEMKWLNNLSIVGTFEGEFSENTVGYAGKGAVRFSW